MKARTPRLSHRAPSSSASTLHASATIATCIIRCKGRVAFQLEAYSGKDTMEVAGLVAGIIDTEKPQRVFVDVGGLGAGVGDRLRELGYGSSISAAREDGRGYRQRGWARLDDLCRRCHRDGY